MSTEWQRAVAAGAATPRRDRRGRALYKAEATVASSALRTARQGRPPSFRRRGLWSANPVGRPVPAREAGPRAPVRDVCVPGGRPSRGRSGCRRPRRTAPAGRRSEWYHPGGGSSEIAGGARSVLVQNSPFHMFGDSQHENRRQGKFCLPGIGSSRLTERFEQTSLAGSGWGRVHIPCVWPHARVW